MNTQRKRILSFNVTSNLTGIAATTTSMPFDDDASVNVHGVNITMGVTPFGPDETLIGRWYVVILPNSIESDVALRNAWISNLNTTALANVALDSSEFIWGAGTILCSDKSVFNLTFAPSTSRNVKKGGRLRVIFVADAISGVIDDWDSAATISLFTS